MHRLSSSFILGYHGCDKAVGEKLVAGEAFIPSENPFDWLGHGVYFWEANPKRGIDYVREMKKRKNFADKFKEPYVIGAVIDLGNCLDLTTKKGIDFVKVAYEGYKKIAEKAGFPLPQNTGKGLLRHLDCAVIEHLHEIIADRGLPRIDSLKGIFVEGDPIYPEAGFHEKTHIQICVRNPECIKGVFKVPSKHLADN